MSTKKFFLVSDSKVAVQNTQRTQNAQAQKIKGLNTQSFKIPKNEITKEVK